jgi:hypothetical protein
MNTNVKAWCYSGRNSTIITIKKITILVETKTFLTMFPHFSPPGRSRKGEGRIWSETHSLAV